MRNVLDEIQLELYLYLKPELRQLKGIVILDDYSLSQTLQIRPGNWFVTFTGYLSHSFCITENMTMPDAYQTKKGSRFLQRPQANETSDLHSPEMSQGILIPKDLPVSSILDKPVPKIGQYFIKITTKITVNF